MGGTNGGVRRCLCGPSASIPVERSTKNCVGASWALGSLLITTCVTKGMLYRASTLRTEDFRPFRVAKAGRAGCFPLSWRSTIQTAFMSDGAVGPNTKLGGVTVADGRPPSSAPHGAVGQGVGNEELSAVGYDCATPVPGIRTRYQAIRTVSIASDKAPAVNIHAPGDTVDS